MASLAGSRTPPPVPGPQQGTAWRSILAATPSTAAISTPFLNGNSANPLLYSSNEERSTSTARSHGARKKNHPKHPPDQKKRFFHFCKTFCLLHFFFDFGLGFYIFLWFLARAMPWRPTGGAADPLGSEHTSIGVGHRALLTQASTNEPADPKWIPHLNSEISWWRDNQRAWNYYRKPFTI